MNLICILSYGRLWLSIVNSAHLVWGASCNFLQVCLVKLVQCNEHLERGFLNHVFECKSAKPT